MRKYEGEEETEPRRESLHDGAWAESGAAICSTFPFDNEAHGRDIKRTLHILCILLLPFFSSFAVLCIMPAWKSFLGLLALAGSAVSCAHHGDSEVVPEHEREELLKKWDQEVFSIDI